MEVLDYKILGDCGLSDHLSVTLILCPSEKATKSTRWKMNVTYQKETKDEVKKIWLEQHPTASFFSKLSKVIRFYRSFCISKAKELRKAESELREEVTNAQNKLQSDQFNGTYQLRVAQLKERLIFFEKSKAEGARIRSRIRWKDKGDNFTAKFFN